MLYVKKIFSGGYVYLKVIAICKGWDEIEGAVHLRRLVEEAVPYYSYILFVDFPWNLSFRELIFYGLGDIWHIISFNPSVDVIENK